MSVEGAEEMNGEADRPTDTVAQPVRRVSIWLRLWPLYLMAAAIGFVFAMGWHEYLSLETLRSQRESLSTLVENQFILVFIAFIAVYILATMLMIPGALWVTIAGGFLFGVVGGTIGTLIGSTTGASILFLAARSSLGKALRERAGPWLSKMEQGFRADSIFYMFALRFMPIVPYPVANIAPALLGARLAPFAMTTFIGVMPAVIAYTWLGAGLGATFDSGEEIDVVSVFRNMAPALGALGVVALVSPLIKRFISKKTSLTVETDAKVEES